MTSLAATVLKLPRPVKSVIAFSVDMAICVATVAVAYWLRLDVWELPVGNRWISYVVAVTLAPALFIYFGIYRTIFRYVGWGAFNMLVPAAAAYAAIYTGLFTFIVVPGVPRSIGVMQPILLFFAVLGSRALVYYWLGGGYRAVFRQQGRRRVLIYGAGTCGMQLIAGIADSDDMTVVGFVDDDPMLQGKMLNGKLVHGADNLPELIRLLNIDDLMLAVPAMSRQWRAQIVDSLDDVAVTIRTVPALVELAQGRVTVSDLRELQIEDLLGREPAPPDALLLARNVTDKTVLVTGGGGSIGSELCRQIMSYRPRLLLVVEISEYNLYEIEKELQKAQPEGTELVCLLASVCDRRRMDAIIRTWRPDTIYHAAAYKHVPLVEHNPAEGLRNNAFGTLNVAELAQHYQVKDFVLVSTDKAVRPTNVMGASKRLAELVLQAKAAQPHPTRFSMVRFGNVLGSSGSVVPLFRSQIKAGGPVTITHQEIVRYFMTIPEAAQLVIQAGAMGTGGEVFVLDMGSPVKVVDLARRMIHLSGLKLKDADNPDGDIEIKFIGLRPGEKLYEELLIGNDQQPTVHPRITRANEHYLTWDELAPHLDALRRAMDDDDMMRIREILQTVVVDYAPSVEVVDRLYLAGGADGSQPIFLQLTGS